MASTVLLIGGYVYNKHNSTWKTQHLWRLWETLNAEAYNSTFLPRNPQGTPNNQKPRATLEYPKVLWA